MKFLGVEFAPLHIPAERRLQTLYVIWYVSMFLVWPFAFSLLAIVSLFTRYYWLTLGYLLWYGYDLYIAQTPARGGRRSNWLRNHPVHNYFRDYFPISLIKTADLDPNKNYVIGTHPHGIVGCSAFCNFASEATGFSKLFPGITPYLLTLRANFLWPVIRGYALWMGVCDVSKASIEFILTKLGKGNAAVIVVGGAQEALDARPGHYKLTLEHRKGFIKIALQTGASLVPTFSFGENDLYCQPDNPIGSKIRKFQDIFKKVAGFLPPIFYGRGAFNYTFGMLPHRKPCFTVVGRPIDVVKDISPTQETIDKYHKIYIQQLSDLFDEYKERYGISKETSITFN